MVWNYGGLVMLLIGRWDLENDLVSCKNMG